MLEMLSKIYQKKGLALFRIINLLGVLKPYLGLDLIDPSLVDIIVPQRNALQH